MSAPIHFPLILLRHLLFLRSAKRRRYKRAGKSRRESSTTRQQEPLHREWQTIPSPPILKRAVRTQKERRFPSAEQRQQATAEKAATEKCFFSAASVRKTRNSSRHCNCPAGIFQVACHKNCSPIVHQRLAPLCFCRRMGTKEGVRRFIPFYDSCTRSNRFCYRRF